MCEVPGAAQRLPGSLNYGVSVPVVGTPKRGHGQSDEAVFSREGTFIKRENNDHQFSWPRLQATTGEEKNPRMNQWKIPAQV